MATFNDGYQFAMEHCPQLDYHGNPFRYCGYCGWVEIEKGPKEAAPEPTGPQPHHCIINAEVDQLAHREQYLIGCQCHEGNTKHIWQPGDPPYVCVTSGVTVEDPRSLIPVEDPDGGE